MEKCKQRVIAFVMTLVMVLAIIPFSTFATTEKKKDYTYQTFTGMDSENLTIATLSDLHYYATSLNGGKNDAYMETVKGSTTTLDLSEPAVKCALETLKKELKGKKNPYLLLTGDLSFQGEYQSNVELAGKLEQWEKETGISVIVIDGNHDINNSKAATYENGVREKTRQTTPEDFREIYKNLGYDIAYHTYTPASGKHGGLSYSVKLDGGYRLILMDTMVYSADVTDDGLDDHQTNGLMTEELFKWVLDECADAKKDGEEIIGVSHCSMLEHMNSYQENIFNAFILNDWEYWAGRLADAGMHYTYCGHHHSSDITSYVSDNGEIIYECETPPTCTFPCGTYVTDFASSKGNLAATYNYFDVDADYPFIIDGVKQEQPFKDKAFTMAYKDNLGSLAADVINNNLGFLEIDIKNAGGISAYIESMLGMSLSEFIGQYFKGIKIGNTEIFTAKNIANFAEDLINQFADRYLNDKDYRDEFVKRIVAKLGDFVICDTPSTKFIDTLGFGDPNKPGTLQDLAYSVLYYVYTGNEDLSDDQFTVDCINTLKSDTKVASDLFYTLVDLIVDDILQEELLSNLHIKFSSLYEKGTLGYAVFNTLDKTLKALCGGSDTYMALIDKVFSLGILPISSIDEILPSIIDEYITESQYDTIGFTLGSVIEGFCYDYTPRVNGDYNQTYTYTGKVPVEATQDNFRLPSIVATTFGDNSQTDLNISWYTSRTVKGTDIEIIPYSDNPVFTGVPTVSGNIKASSEVKERQFPGLDFGIIGILTVHRVLTRHNVTLTGLEPGKKYCYRVGDASRNWWSDVGVIKTANGSDKVTFIHASDDQSQSAHQYDVWYNLLDKAFDMYPDADFIMNTGDIVDWGTNLKQWAWAMNAPKLMETTMMPVAGNHDTQFGATYALADNFFLSHAPEDQDFSSGIYYSFDYNNTHFAILNTNDLDENDALTEKQIEWLKNDMNSSDAQWKFVALHKAPYSNGSHFDDDDVIQIRKQLSTLMPQLGIDVVFQGHDHVYLRTDVMNNNKVVKTPTKEIEYNGHTYSAKMNPNGTIYAISACAGVKYYVANDPALTDKLFPRAEKIVDCYSPAFSSIQIDGDYLYFDAYTVDGDDVEEIDSFAICKDGSNEKEDLLIIKIIKAISKIINTVC